VGYRVDVPLSQLCSLPGEGKEVTLWTYTYVREDAFKLFGFATHEDRMAFEILLSISGVGPKVALAILSTLSIPVIVEMVQQDDSSMFEVVPGIGNRLAEKILVDLKPKVKKLMPHARAAGSAKAVPAQEVVASRHQQVYQDLKSGLENLGFKEKDFAPTLTNLLKDNPEQSFQWLIKEALTELKSQRGGKPKAKTQITPEALSDVF
jgi:Holliday junction DNA helicase RuvA